MSTWTFTCVNHPTYRWTKNKCGGGFIGRGVLSFEGDLETRKPGNPWGFAERHMADLTAEQREHFLERYTPECDCPFSDLRVVAREYQPFTEACERFHNPGFVSAPSGRVHKTLRGRTLCGRAPSEGWRDSKTDRSVLDAYKCATCYGKQRQQHLRAA